MSEYITETVVFNFEAVPGELMKHASIDVTVKEEIVRCRDCKYYIEDSEPIDPGWPMMCADSGRDMLEPGGFCACGERKSE